MMQFEELIVPALTGKYGEWRYYQVILNVKNIVESIQISDSKNYRVKTVDEVEEIYSKKGVSNLLQRAYDPRRLNPIKNYILKQKQRYLNNLTIGLYGGNPDWMDINISAYDKELTEGIKSIQKKLGFIKFNGLETLFVLDGQHRLKGLREAYEQNPKKIENDEIVCTLIIHKPDNEGRIKTRRLFSTINRQAKPVSKGENILLDEDDASAIMVRELIENYKEFKNRKIIALSKGANISSKDFDKFTTVVTLWTINEKLIDKDIYHKIDGNIIRTRPSEKVLKHQKTRVFNYWNKFFDLFPNAKSFIEKTKEERVSSRDKGGDFILRPIAQMAVFEILHGQGQSEFDSKSILRLRKLPASVTDNFWAYVLWNPFNSTMLTNRSLVRNYIKYNIGLDLKPSELRSLKEKYKSNSGDNELDLPSPKFIN